MAKTKAYWENKSSKSNTGREGRGREGGKNTGGLGAAYEHGGRYLTWRHARTLG